MGRWNCLTIWGWFLGLQQAVRAKSCSQRRKGRSTCGMRTGMLPTVEEGQEVWRTGNNEFHFLPAVVLGLNCRESTWVRFPYAESPGGHLCVCVQAVSAQQVCTPGRELRQEWRMGRLMGPVWVHGGMAQASVNVPFQRRFPVARYILAVKAPLIQMRAPTDAVCWCWKIAWGKLWIFTCLCYDFLLWEIPC